MTNSINIVLPTDYTVEQAYEDAALATGYSSTIVITEVDNDSVPPVMKSKTVPNPVSMLDHGKAVWLSVINERLTTTKLKAEEIKLKSFSATI